jgi:rRNA maturation endonuclease Nob1
VISPVGGYFAAPVNPVDDCLPMRIHNEDDDTSVQRVTLFLTPEEAREMRDAVDTLLMSTSGSHVHVPSEEYTHEVTLCVYEADQLNGLSERARQLIAETV